MGYAVIMFVIMLLLAVSIALSANYGISKDSHEAPLLAENAYAERETGKAQTGLTIVNTCLKADSSTYDRYTKPPGNSELVSGPYTLYLLVRNNGSTVLNPNNATVIYNSSYINFSAYRNKDYNGWRDDWKYWWDYWNVCNDDWKYWSYENIIFFRAWTPLTYTCMKASGIYISTPNAAAQSPEIRLLVSAENGISTIAPTSPINFTGMRNSSWYNFRWNASYDEDGIAYYRLYRDRDGGGMGSQNYCYDYDIIAEIPGNRTYYNCPESLCGDGGGGGSQGDYFRLTAVDTLQNEDVQSRTINCGQLGACTN